MLRACWISVDCNKSLDSMVILLLVSDEMSENIDVFKMNITATYCKIFFKNLRSDIQSVGTQGHMSGCNVQRCKICNQFRGNHKKNC